MGRRIELNLGVTSIVKIGEVRFSGEIGGFIITIRYKIPTKDQFLKRGGGGQENFGQKLKF